MLHAGLRLADRYRLDARLGAGGMGEVWRAVDEVLGRVVAVKAMLPEVADQPDFAKRFLVEAKAMASVNHPAVASIHDYGRGSGITFLVMEFIDGESLSQVLARIGRLDPATTMRLLAQAADGLRAVHERGIVHRDIKPANLLIRRDGTLLITDFGISRTHDGTQLTASGAVLGTPTYLSPEQVLGRPATGLSDVYSLGLVAYECLAGRRPFEGDNPYAIALQRLRTAPPPLGGDIPGPVRAVIDRALATEPADRWPSAAAMAYAARTALDGHWPAPAPTPAPWPGPGPGPVPSLSSDGRSAPSPASDGWATPSPSSGGGSVPLAASGGWATPSSGPAGRVTPTPPPGPGAHPASIPSPGGSRVPASVPVAEPASAPASVPVAGLASRPGSRPRRWAVPAAILVVIVAGGATTWRILTPGRDDRPAAGASPAGVSPTGASPAGATVPAGFFTCGPMLCPAKPLCWAGLVASAGRATPPPRDLDCAQSHAWETFAATRLPPDVAASREDELLGRKDIAAACSAKLLADRSREPGATKGWIIEAWPIEMTGGRLVHCLAAPEARESSGSAFATS